MVLISVSSVLRSFQSIVVHRDTVKIYRTFNRLFTCSACYNYRSRQQRALASLLIGSNQSEIKVPLFGVDENSDFGATVSDLKDLLNHHVTSRQNRIHSNVDKFPELLIDLNYVEKSLQIFENEFNIDPNVRSEIVMDHPWTLLLHHQYLSMRIHQIIESFDQASIQFDTYPVDSYGALFALRSIKFKAKVYSVKQMSELYGTAIDDNRFNDRLDYFSAKFSLSHLRVIEYFHVHPQLFTSDISKIDQITYILTELAGLHPEDIRRDFYIYRINPEFISSRVRKLKDIGLHPIKVWMLRCEDYVLEPTIKLWKQRIKIFGSSESDVVDYLCKTLQITPEIVDEMVEACPNLLSTRPAKLKNLTEYLFSIGATTQEIVDCPRIYQMSLATVKARIESLKTRSVPRKYFLRIIKLHNKRFEELCIQLKR